MPRKPKFRPEINRIKLNPEQAVLMCDCYNIHVGYFNTPIHLYPASDPSYDVCYASGAKHIRSIRACTHQHLVSPAGISNEWPECDTVSS